MLNPIADMAYDLGTRNSELYVKGLGFFPVKKAEDQLNEGKTNKNQDDSVNSSGQCDEDKIGQLPSFVARRTNGKLVAVGERAYRMLGATPGDQEVVRPVKLGRIHDEQAFVDTMVSLVKHPYPNFETLKHMNVGKYTAVIPVPCNATPLEHQAIRDLAAKHLKAHAVLVLEPVAAAIGARLKFNDDKACAIIDIGGGTADFAVLSFGRELPYSDSFELGGDLMDTEIQNYVLKTHNIGISERTAEWIKQMIGSVKPFRDDNGDVITLTATIKGRPQGIGENVKSEVTLTDQQIRDHCLVKVFGKIGDKLRTHIQKIESNRVHTQLRENGVSLTGGPSFVHGADEFLGEMIGIKVMRVERPLLSVILGSAAILQDRNLLKSCDIRKSAA